MTMTSFVSKMICTIILTSVFVPIFVLYLSPNAHPRKYQFSNLLAEETYKDLKNANDAFNQLQKENDALLKKVKQLERQLDDATKMLNSCLLTECPKVSEEFQESVEDEPKSYFAYACSFIFAALNAYISFPFANSIAEDLPNPVGLLVLADKVYFYNRRVILLLISWCASVRILYFLNSYYELSNVVSFSPIFINFARTYIFSKTHTHEIN